MRPTSLRNLFAYLHEHPDIRVIRNGIAQDCTYISGTLDGHHQPDGMWYRNGEDASHYLPLVSALREPPGIRESGIIFTGDGFTVTTYSRTITVLYREKEESPT